MTSQIVNNNTHKSRTSSNSQAQHYASNDSNGKKYISPSKNHNSNEGSSQQTQHIISESMNQQTLNNIKGIDAIEDSIKSEQMGTFNITETINTKQHQAEELSQSLGETHPKMRRVKNPYGSSEHSSSQKSGTLSQSMQKSKRKIEIEKLSDGEENPYEDSY